MTAIAYACRAEANSLTLGTYTTLQAARDHCEADLTNNIDTEDGILAWIPEDGNPGSPEQLSIFGPGLNDEDVTGYTITPVELLTAYDPNAEG